MLELITVVLLVCSFASAAETDWNGVFNDAIWGGSINVCVSNTNSKFYGQATFSDLGYMVGEIDSNDVWSGNFFIQGYDAQQGTFSFTLVSGSFTGTWQYKGQQDSIDTSGSQTSSVEPKADVCFKVDDNFIDANIANPFSISGTYKSDNSDTDIYYSLDGGDGTFYGSYQYTWGAGNTANGFFYGPIQTIASNGIQVGMADWYEAGNTVGLELYVAKNASSYYYMWLWIPRTSDYDISKSMKNGTSIRRRISEDTSMYNSQHCLTLPQSVNEATCFQTTTLPSDDDDNTALLTNMSISSTAFTILNFVILMIVCLMVSTIKKAGVAAPLNNGVELSDKV